MLPLRVAIEKLQQRMIRRALRVADGNPTRAARYLVIPRVTLYAMCDRLDIVLPDRKPGRQHVPTPERKRRARLMLEILHSVEALKFKRERGL